MKRFILIFFALVTGITSVFAQFADPAVTGASFSPDQINTGQTTLLTVSFSNTGSTPIPVNSIEITISTAFNYYTTDSSMAPTGPGAILFNWTHFGTTGSEDVWRGTNKVEIGAFVGEDILLTVTGNAVSPGFETTNINVQPTSNFNKFLDSPTNNSIQPELKINQACPSAPVLSGSTKSNVCPLTTADLTTLQPATVSGQTFEWHTVASNPTARTIVSQPKQVPAGTYYLYAKDTFCYSPASAATTVIISACISPDLIPNFTYLSTTFTKNTSKTVIININEISGGSTNGTPVSVFIPSSTGFTYAFNPDQTSATIVNLETVNNPDWTMTIKPTGILLSSIVLIPSNGRSRIAITITANTPGALSNVTVNITPNGGGENNPFNNLASLAQSIQK